jgi:hypothetical protein
MHTSKNLHQLKQFLKPYKELWQYEILAHHPNRYSDEIESWGQSLASLTSKDLIQIYQGHTHPNIPQELNQLLATKNDLIQIPFIHEYTHKNSELFGVSKKKQHELTQIKAFLQKQIQPNEFKQFHEYACGKAATGMAIGKHFPNVKFFGFDIDSQFKTKSRDLFQLNKTQHLFEFHQADLFQLPVKINPNSFNFGLHTCGDLSFHLIQLAGAQKQKYFLNFGCCHHKIYHQKLYDQDGEKFSTEALHLANFSMHPMTEASLSYKYHVKKYRYIFEFYLKDVLDYQKPIILKSSRPSLYRGTFYNYCIKHWKKLGIKEDINQHQDALNLYIENPNVIKKFHRLFYLGFIREIFARPLELIINLEKVKLLENLGYQTQLMQFFNPQISQRNLGIWSKKV